MNLFNGRFTPRIGGIVTQLQGMFGSDKKEKEPVDTDKDGKTLFKEDIIKFVKDELERRRKDRLPLELQWTLNSNMLCGNQYCDINTHSSTIEQIEPVHDCLEREVFNMIAPLIETRTANLKKISYAMRCKPRTNEYDDYAKAEVSTSLLDHVQSVSDFESKKNTMIAWNELCGNCFWLSWWDSSKGERYLTESKVAVVDETSAAEITTEVICEGDLDYGLLTPYEVFPESLYKQTVADQRSIIIEQVKSVEDIYDLYGIEVEGRCVETFSLTPIASGYGLGKESAVMALGHRSEDDAVTLITYFERPSRRYKDGRMIIICEDELIYYGELPYGRIPLVQTIAREVPGQFFGKSVIEDLIPKQRAYNGCVNRIHEYIKRFVIQSYAVEEGSVDVEEFEENGQTPGYLLKYKTGANPPTPLPNGVLPSEIQSERYNLVRDMEYVAGVSQLMTSGAAPTGVTSGVALEAIRATDDTRLSLTGDHIRNSVKALAELWLEIYKIFAKNSRVLNCHGGNGLGSVLIWSGEDISSYDIEFVAENELLYGEDAQKQRFFEAYNLGMFADENGRIPTRVKMRALEHMKTGNYTELMNIDLLQLQTAQRENAMFADGVLPRLKKIDNHDIHIEEHMRYILQLDFDILRQKRPEYAQSFEEHIEEHKKAMALEKMQEMQNMNNMQLQQQ